MIVSEWNRLYHWLLFFHRNFIYSLSVSGLQNIFFKQLIMTTPTMVLHTRNYTSSYHRQWTFLSSADFQISFVLISTNKHTHTHTHIQMHAHTHTQNQHTNKQANKSIILHLQQCHLHRSQESKGKKKKKKRKLEEKIMSECSHPVIHYSSSLPELIEGINFTIFIHQMKIRHQNTHLNKYTHKISILYALKSLSRCYNSSCLYSQSSFLQKFILYI